MHIKKEKFYCLILLAVLVFSAAVYFYSLEKESLSTDEYFSLYVSQQAPLEIIAHHKTVSNPNTIPPLYVIILHYWLKIFGQGEFAQRSLSAFLGVLSVYLLYRLTLLLFDIRTAILSALFGTLSYTWFSFFRQNRCYSLFILLTLLSFYYFFSLLKDKNARRYFIYLTITNILLLYTHYFSFLVVALEAAFGIFEWRKDKNSLRNIILMCAFVGLAYLPWYPNLIYDLKREPIVVDKTPFVSTSRLIFDILRIMFSDFHFLWSPILTVLYIPFVVKGLIKLRKTSFGGSRHNPVYLILILVIPFVFLYGYIFTDRTRYYAPFMFPLLILLAYGLLDIDIRGITRKIIFLAVSVVIISNNVLDFADFYNVPTDEEWKQAVSLIKQIPDYRNKGNVFIFQTRYNPPVFSYYYWGPKSAAGFIDKIAKQDNYENNLALIGAREKLTVIEEMKGKEFFKKLNSFPEDAWIWIFRYHDLTFPKDFKTENKNRFFFHQIRLNKELTPIDLFLLKKIKGNA